MGLRALNIIGYPKSGNTWATLAFEDLLELYDPLDKVIIDIHQAIKFKESFPIRSRGDDKWVLIKSHFKHKKHVEESLHVVTRSVVENYYFHILRNPLDVFLSYLNYLRIVLQRKSQYADSPQSNYLIHELGWDKSIDVFIKEGTLEYLSEIGFLDKAVYSFMESNLELGPLSRMSGSWIDHYLSWTTALDKNVCLLKYEDLTAKNKDVFIKMSRMLGWSSEGIEQAFDKITNKKVNFKKMNCHFIIKQVPGTVWSIYQKILSIHLKNDLEMC